MEKLLYAEARAGFAPGDALGWCGQGALSGAIEFITGSDVTHISIVLTKIYDGEHRWLQMEAYEGGHGILGGCVNDTFISERIKKYDGDVVWYKLHPDLDEYRQDIANELWLQKRKGKGYDYKNLILNLFGRRPLDDDSFFCSELAEWAYKKRLPLSAFHNHPQWITDPDFKIFLSNKRASRPGDIAGLPFLFRQGQLVMET